MDLVAYLVIKISFQNRYLLACLHLKHNFWNQFIRINKTRIKKLQKKTSYFGSICKRRYVCYFTSPVSKWESFIVHRVCCDSFIFASLKPSYCYLNNFLPPTFFRVFVLNFFPTISEYVEQTIVRFLLTVNKYCY